jgi:hypothetical protein
MRYCLPLIFVAVALAGCVSEIVGPDGPAYFTRCAAAACFARAAETCPNGYDIFSDTVDAEGTRDIAFTCRPTTANNRP